MFDPRIAPLRDAIDVDEAGVEAEIGGKSAPSGWLGPLRDAEPFVTMLRRNGRNHPVNGDQQLGAGNAVAVNVAQWIGGSAVEALS